MSHGNPENYGAGGKLRPGHSPELSERQRVEYFAGIVPVGGASRELTQGQTSDGCIARLIEWRRGESEPRDARTSGCPGNLLHVSLVGRIDNARDLARELTARGHELTATGDAEVIAHAYEEWGDACLERLWGVFALALWDERARVLLLARDRIGSRALYYRQAHGFLAFGSRLTALRELMEIPRDIDPEAMDSYLALGTVPAPFSIYRGVNKLPSACFLKCERTTVTMTRYWTVEFPTNRCSDFSQAAEEFAWLLNDAIQRIDGHEPSALMLSGGPDSGMILAGLSELKGRARTFSFAFVGEHDELEDAQRTARYFHSDHQAFHIEPRVADVLTAMTERYEEPHAPVTAVGWRHMESSMAAQVRVVLAGNGADEVFGGRDRHLVVGLIDGLYRFPGRRIMSAVAATAGFVGVGGAGRTLIQSAGMSPAERHSYWLSTFSPRARAELYSQDFGKRIQVDHAYELIAQLVSKSVRPHDQTFAVDVGLWLPEVVLATFATIGPDNVDMRLPFLDHRIVELAATFPPSFRTRRMTSKLFLRKVYAGRLPDWLHISRRRGAMSLPVARRLRGELRPWLEECVLSPTAMQRGYFKPEIVRRLVAEHVNGKADHAARLWALLMLESWHLQRDVP